METDLNKEKILDEMLWEKLQSIEKESNPAPEELKEEVFSTLDTVNFFADLADLFTVKFTEVELAVLEAMNEVIEEEE